MQRICDGWVVNPKQDPPSKAQESWCRSGWKESTSQETGKGMQSSVPDTVIGVRMSQQLELPLLGLHKIGLIISQPWVREELPGSYFPQLNYWLWVDSREGATITFSCLPTSKFTGSKLMVTQTALVKFSGSQTKTRVWIQERDLEGKWGWWSWEEIRWE